MKAITLQALTVEALAPAIRDAVTLKHDFHNFFNQVNTDYFGTYLCPHPEGILVTVVTDCYSVSVLDKTSKCDDVYKVRFPDSLLDIATVKWTEMFSSDNDAFPVAMQPKPCLVICNDIFAMVTVEDVKREDMQGILGAWDATDSKGENYTQYAIEPIPADLFVLGSHLAELEGLTYDGGNFAADPFRLMPILSAFKTFRLGVQIECASNRAIRLTSAFTGDSVQIKAYLAPLSPKGGGE